MARDAVRGISTTWSHNLFGFAMKPHLVFYLDVDPNELVHRVFQKNSSLDYYESGADLGLSDNMLKSFLIYQGLIAKQFRKMQRKYGLIPINGNRPMAEIHKDLQDKIDYFLKNDAKRHVPAEKYLKFNK
jgi:dTMP kinase